jgi:hypothetical protein
MQSDWSKNVSLTTVLLSDLNKGPGFNVDVKKNKLGLKEFKRDRGSILRH